MFFLKEKKTNAGKKAGFSVLGVMIMASCIHAQSESLEPDLLMPLPVPELSVEMMAELSTAFYTEETSAAMTLTSAPLSEDPLYPELTMDGSMLFPPPAPARPLRITPYAPPERLNEQPQSRTVDLRECTIAGIDQDLTQEYIVRYSSPKGIELLEGIMRRGAPYFAFIRKEVETRNLPMELMYLPVIESAYLPTAVSRSGAVGLWQFMKNSMSPYDMRVTDWLDERMDFWKSTIGALSKLEENYRELGDWSLALAAYNAGLGRVSRTIQQTKIRDYWLLSERKQFSTETVHYVPKLLAIAYIMSNPRYFGIEPVWHDDPEWTRVKVGRMVDLELLASEAGIDKRDLKSANRELLYNVTPPDPNYYLKVRSADADAVAAVLARQDLPLIRYYFHTVASGDTLSEIAQHFGVTVDTILKNNAGIQARYLKIGTRLLIPAYKDVGPYRPAQRTVSAQMPGTHTVKSGDTLWSIAKTYKTTPETLARLNGMGLNDILRVGRQLKLK
ncbi:MAG: LysM peptidoglycan-binding domain-containing protein [Spirochaetaceae bacterium]|jgi:membrane-bound lytic murein transglycosylase D|nr:LysM peptidoglycan-binding domain-containing protein [Spirochaetaceae bacterium]